MPEVGEHGMPGPVNNQTNGAKGGWTECQVAEMKNGSVILTSRNLYNDKSGLSGRMFARSDDVSVAVPAVRAICLFSA